MEQALHRSRAERSGARSPRPGGLARALGWFSIGLGVAELLAPRAMARATGLRGKETLLRAYGLREIATGAAILASDEPGPWLWGRVGGDALDLATLGAGLARRQPHAGTAFAIAAVAGVAVVDALCARALTPAARAATPHHDDGAQALPPAERRSTAREGLRTLEDQRTTALHPHQLH